MKDFRFFPYKLLTKYPHMLGQDVDIWTRFIKRYPKKFDKVAYDIRVGSGVTISDIYSEKLRKMASTLTQKRIDCLCVSKNKYFLVEVKFHPRTSVLGQLLGYKALFHKTYPSILDVEMVLVSNSICDDLTYVLSKYPIQIFTV